MVPYNIGRQLGFRHVPKSIQSQMDLSFPCFAVVLSIWRSVLLVLPSCSVSVRYLRSASSD